MSTIIFVHKGNSYYLQLSIAQAKKYNPDSNILLFGDESNRNIQHAIHYNIDDYDELADRFDKVFFNNSPNRRSYELFCFQRWFIIREFMMKHPEYDTDFVYCDPDTLLYGNVESDLKNLAPKIIATESWESPAFTFFKKGTLSDFCDMVMWLYTTKEGLDTIIHYINQFERESAIQGISDMTAFKHYTTVFRAGQCVDSQQPSTSWNSENNDGGCLFCYDHNINLDNGFITDIWGRKRIKNINHTPFGILKDTGSIVQFKGLHYQGDAKYMMIAHQSVLPPNLYYIREYVLGWSRFRMKIFVRWILKKGGCHCE